MRNGAKSTHDIQVKNNETSCSSANFDHENTKSNSAAVQSKKCELQAWEVKLPYVPLRNHTSYSLLEGAITPQQLVDRSVQHHMVAIGINDTGNLFGAMEFSLLAQKAGLKPLIGCLLPVIMDSTTTAGQTKFNPALLPLFVQNVAGYHNLSRLVTMTTVGQSPDWRGCVTWEQLAPHTSGLIALTGGDKGPVHMAFSQSKQAGEATLAQLNTAFSQRLYVEIERVPNPSPFEDALLAWAYAHHVPLVATNQAFFLDAQDHSAHDALLCIKETTYVAEQNRRRESVHRHLKAPEDMQTLFADIPEALQNTVHVAKRCSFFLEEQRPTLPPYPVQANDTPENVLCHKANEGLAARLDEPVSYKRDKVVYEKRLAYELEVIHTMGFVGYFLIVADFIDWAKRNGIAVGPGRGSGAGSIVAWCLRITDADPLHFGLLFERFLNPERVSMPDFDIDFCPERRDEVIAYVRDKYGAASVAHIITFGKLQARAVLRDVGRVLGMPYGQIDKLAKRIPFNPANPMTLSQVLAEDTELDEMRQTDESVGLLFSHAQKLEGLYRHASTHAAGVVIGDGPLTRMMPLYQDPKSPLPATQFSMKYVEKMGLVKFDFLGLKTLTVLEESVTWAYTLDGKTIHLSTLPIDDGPTFKLLQQAHVAGLFQLESAGMRDVLRQLKPQAFQEIIALVALYRPGPMDNIPHFIACRHGQEKVTYPYPELEDILKETFGVMVYQEQVLNIAQRLAGYSLGQADLLRRAMGKKIKSEMDAQRKVFVEGAVKKVGGSAAKAAELFDQIAKFAGYAFNKAHAMTYALITYQTAYMKANHPLAFMLASMNQDRHNTDRLAFFVTEAQRMGIKLLQPDINHSNVLFVPQKGCIRYGLSALKNVGEGAMQALVNEREKNGPYTCVFDVFERLGDNRVLNKRQMEHLVWAGAFDMLPINEDAGEVQEVLRHRRYIVENLETLLAYGTQGQTQAMLFDKKHTRPQLKATQAYRRMEALTYTYQAIGMYLHEHPLDPFQSLFVSQDILPLQELGERIERLGTARIGGVLINLVIKKGRSGKRYAFATFSDTTGTCDIMLFEDTLQAHQAVLTIGSLWVCSVVSKKMGESSRLIVEKATSLKQALQALPALHIHAETEEDVANLARVLSQVKQGKTPVSMFLTLKAEGVATKAPQDALQRHVETSSIKSITADEACVENLWLSNLKVRVASSA